MQISVRSCLAAGLSLTTATAIALTPVTAPANERAVPSVTTADIQLTVTPGEVRDFFHNLQAQLVELNQAVADAARIPGQTVVDALHSAIALNDQFFDRLVGSTDNLTLQALFQTLQLSNDNGLGSLAAAINRANNEIVLSGRDLANLFDATVTSSLANVVAAVVRVANDPLSFYNWARVPSAVVSTATLVGNNGGQSIRTVGNLGFELAQTGIELAEAQINNAINTVRGLINIGAQATGSPLIRAVVAAVQAITIGPLQLGIILPLALGNDVLGEVQNGFNTVFDGLVGNRGPDGEYVPGIIGIGGQALSLAIQAIGEDPLSVYSYTGAAGLLAQGGFDVFNKTVETTAAVARVPFDLAINILDPDEFAPSLTNVIIRFNNQVAAAIAGVLAAVGLPDDIATLPLTFADQVNGVIRAGAGAAVSGLNAGIGVIDDSATFIVDVSHSIENVILGTGSEAEPEPTAPEPSPERSPIATASVVDDISEDEPSSEDSAAEEASGDETSAGADAPSEEETPAEDAPTDSDDESEKKASYTSRNDDRRAEREATKAEKAEKPDSGSDSGDNSGSDSEPADSAAA